MIFETWPLLLKGFVLWVAVSLILFKKDDWWEVFTTVTDLVKTLLAAVGGIISIFLLVVIEIWLWIDTVNKINGWSVDTFTELPAPGPKWFVTTLFFVFSYCLVYTETFEKTRKMFWSTQIGKELGPYAKLITLAIPVLLLPVLLMYFGKIWHIGRGWYLSSLIVLEEYQPQMAQVLEQYPDLPQYTVIGLGLLFLGKRMLERRINCTSIARFSRRAFIELKRFLSLWRKSPSL